LVEAAAAPPVAVTTITWGAWVGAGVLVGTSVGAWVGITVTTTVWTRTTGVAVGNTAVGVAAGASAPQPVKMKARAKVNSFFITCLLLVTFFFVRAIIDSSPYSFAHLAFLLVFIKYNDFDAFP
jgi:hypothetical protein